MTTGRINQVATLSETRAALLRSLTIESRLAGWLALARCFRRKDRPHTTRRTPALLVAAKRRTFVRCAPSSAA